MNTATQLENNQLAVQRKIHKLVAQKEKLKAEIDALYKIEVADDVVRARVRLKAKAERELKSLEGQFDEQHVPPRVLMLRGMVSAGDLDMIGEGERSRLVSERKRLDREVQGIDHEVRALRTTRDLIVEQRNLARWEREQQQQGAWSV